MFRTSPTQRSLKGIRHLVKPQTHVQKKYFSLMLVPSYSSGKTRSIRIPYGIFYFIIISFFVIAAVILTFYLKADYFQQVAQDFSASLEQATEAYYELQETKEAEQSKLINDSNSLKSALSEEITRSQIEKSRQEQSYQESLDAIQEQVDEMDRLIRELQEERQAIINQLSAKSYIPPIKSMLENMNESQTTLLNTVTELQIQSDERSSETHTTAQDLYDYFTVMTAKLETQFLCYADLQAQITKMKPYIKNYPTIWPVYGQVSSRYGYRRNPMGGRGGEFHDGYDIRTPTGTSVKATGGGTVETAGWMNSYGNVVIINHGFGIQTVYAHNSSLLVSAGQRVERGTVIARSGSTGRSTGPHVHYEVRVNGSSVNPEKFLLE